MQRWWLVMTSQTQHQAKLLFSISVDNKEKQDQIDLKYSFLCAVSSIIVQLTEKSSSFTTKYAITLDMQWATIGTPTQNARPYDLLMSDGKSVITTNDIVIVDKIAYRKPAKLTLPLWHSISGVQSLPRCFIGTIVWDQCAAGVGRQLLWSTI